MTLFEIIILALIQGLTEFLPISSSGHLLLPEILMGWSPQGLAFDVAVHVGSLVAVVTYYRQDVGVLMTHWFRFGWARQGGSEHSQQAWWIIFATVPALAVGFLTKSWIEEYARNGWVIASTTLLFGLVLGWSDKRHDSPYFGQLNAKKAMLIGLAQCLALLPGTSRSGVTMSAGLLLGLGRQQAARFSFLLSIPIIVAAGSLSAWDLINSDVPVAWGALFMGAGFSFLSAYACIYLFVRWIEKIGMRPFMWYRIILAIVLYTSLCMAIN